jgi:hypothetical protein
VTVCKRALLLGLAPKDFIVAIGVERRVNVNQVNAGVGQFGELFQIVAAINDAGVEERRGETRRDEDFNRGAATGSFVVAFFAIR